MTSMISQPGGSSGGIDRIPGGCESIVIIGGGVIGVSIAYYLAKAKLASNGKPFKITLIEAVEIAAGASGKAGGLLALDWHEEASTSLAALSYRLHAELAAQHDGKTEWDYRAIDTYSLSADLSTPTVSPTSSSSPPSSKKREQLDWLDSRVGNVKQLGTKSTTAQVHPAKFTRAMLKLSGVNVVYGDVTSLNRDREDMWLEVKLQESSAGVALLRANKVIIAAGPWTGAVAQRLIGGENLGRAKDISGERAHSVVIAPPQGKSLPAQALFTSIKTTKGVHEPEIYNRPDGTAYACGPTDSSPLPLSAALVKVDSAAIESILTQVATLSPDYLDVSIGAKVITRQACYLPTGSGQCVIGEVEPGIYIASGHSCWGITLAPGTGKVMAELVLNGKVTSADISQLGP